MKKLLALALALTMVFAFVAACGDAPADGADLEPVRIGILGPHTGPVAEFGLAVRDGALLYIDKFNDAGGLPNGRLIEPILFDDEHDPVTALMGYHYLLDRGVVAILGGVTSGPTMAVVPQAFEDNVPMITASATHAGVTYDAETGTVFTNMFRTCFIDPFQGEKMAEFAYTVLNSQAAAVIYNLDIDYSIGLTYAFLEKAEAIGLNIVAVEGYSGDAVDFSGQLTNIAAQNPDVLFIPDYHDVIALLSVQARSAGIDATLLGADGWSAVVDVMAADTTPVEGSFFLSGFSVEDESPLVQAFLADYVARFNEEPIMFAAQAYDAASILLTAIAAAEASGYEEGSHDYRSVIINSMAATDDTFVTGHITFDRYNNPVKTAFMIEIRDGQARFWGTF